jgi:DNA (cytosine-5)-methyltransferase 1
MLLRRLTPLECERLQGFPDGWTEYGMRNGNKVKISDSHRFKMLGNAITTNVAEEIGKKLR